ncbi:MAG: LytR/AlgR family response regulator transcription factor [Flavobacteriales bacterium]
MKVKKILIIEDEKPNADRLKRLLLEMKPQLEILAVIESVSNAVDWLVQNENPDIILMDVRLSDGLSFEIFNQTEVESPVIFTTAYDEYAVRAFKYNSIDYLLKPIQKEELQAALEKYDSLIDYSFGGGAALKNLLNYIQPKEYRNRFLIPYRDSYKTVMANDIAFFYSELNITRAKLFNGEEEVLPQTLEKLEQQLDPKLFFRANRQYIIHMDAIQKVHNHFNGKLKIELKKNTGTEVLISREKASVFKAWLDY